MFYKLIEKKRDEWLSSPNCKVKDFIDYIVNKGEMRDAQIESIRTYLYLKIACGNKPLWKLFAEGVFNDPDYKLNPAEYGSKTYQTIMNNAGAMALMQYAQPDPKSAPVLPKLKELLRIKAEDIDYEAVFKSIFYDEDYTDYVFSLPMGAGKTYLMAAFIYIDLYFAKKDEGNPVWAHNFMIFAPSGTKSSIMPSLRNIKRFNPSWVIPEPEASKLKKLVSIEILDQQRAAKDSNQVKNPNAQKIRLHQQNNDEMGLVAITNAEKVILDRVEKKDAQPELFQTAEQKKEWEQIKVANELRDVIGRIPNLSIFVDEVHHVVDKENKLKQVIEQWTAGQTFNGMIGFSGTPYLKKPYRITIGTEQPLKDSSMATVVYYYPLASGIKNFLKTPRIEDSELPSRELLDKGVRDFLDNYMDVAYDIEGNGNLRKAKLAIFCRSIANLEREVYPQVSQIVTEYGMSSDVLLPYHQGGKEGKETFPAPKDAGKEFQRLDEDSDKRIVLLVRIGQEGWDCKSLSGVIMPYEPDTKSPQNSVLQRTCRCLRQAVKYEDETALIWLNRANATYLDQQLREEQNSSLAEIKAAGEKEPPTFQRYSRMGRQRVPEIPFCQLELNHVERIDEVKPDTKAVLESSDLLIKAQQFWRNTRKEDLLEIKDSTSDLAGGDVPMTFTEWFYLILKEGTYFPDEEMLLEYESQLRTIFSSISIEKEDGRYLSEEYDQEAIREAIRKAFLTERTAVYHREEIRRDAHIMVIRHDGETERIDDNQRLNDFQPADENKYFPTQQTVKEIVDADDNPPTLTEDEREFVEFLRAKGEVEKADRREREFLAGHQLSTDARHKDATYQYLPYRFDSELEKNFFRDILASVDEQQLEMYFNGDEHFTSFIIKPYKITGNDWEALQQYVPDFLVLSRRDDGSIDRVLIIETKGQLYADSFKDKHEYMTDTFLELNRNREGLPQFDFLYLEADKDNKNLPQLEERTRDTIKTFFKR